jgi:Tfp pilus assembly protein PilV
MTQHTPVRAESALRNRAGFTLVEVVVAAVILTGALLAMAGFTVRYQRTASRAELFNRGQQLANQRLEAVRSATPYMSLDTMARTESTVPGFPGYSRVTQVSRVGGAQADTVDYRVITVRVNLPAGAERPSVTKTTLVAAF